MDRARSWKSSATASEGLRRAAMGRWDLYIVDRMLPDTDGL
jgi:DNA-binding response OmpR family regulator